MPGHPPHTTPNRFLRSAVCASSFNSACANFPFPECGRRPIQKLDAQAPMQKARGRRRGLNSCDDDNVPVICPACQFS
jgi:hypothetical protein